MTHLNDYRHPAKGMNETQMEVAIDNLRRLDEDEVGMYAYSIIESVTDQMIEAEDGLNESSLEYETMTERQKRWREMHCENSVRINGCEDQPPYYDIPWIEGPIPTVYTERHCSTCIEEWPDTEIEDGEAVYYFNEEARENGGHDLEYITASEANKFSGTILGMLTRTEDGELIRVDN